MMKGRGFLKRRHVVAVDPGEAIGDDMGGEAVGQAQGGMGGEAHRTRAQVVGRCIVIGGFHDAVSARFAKRLILGECV